MGAVDEPGRRVGASRPAPHGRGAVVLATGNHYVLDVVGSAVALVAAIAVAHLWGRLVTPAGAPLASRARRDTLGTQRPEP